MAKSTVADNSRFKSKTWYQLLVVIWLVDLFLRVRAPIDRANLDHYGISVPWFYLIQLSFALSILLIWALAMYGAVSFKGYAHNIRNSEDGSALNTAANGLLVLVVGIMASGVLNQSRNYFADPEMSPWLTIAMNQVQVLGYLGGFYLLWRGSSRLVGQIKASSQAQKWQGWLLVPFTIVAGAYAFLSSVDPDRLVATTPHVKFATYYLPDILLMGLVILPYVLSWLLAIYAAINLSLYRQNVKGTFYRQALKGLVQGIIAVTAFSIGMQFLRVLSSSLVELNTAGILILVYLILLAYTGSYLLIARGARKLHAIEEAV